MVNINICKQNFMPKYDKLEAHEIIQNEHESIESYEFKIPKYPEKSKIIPKI